MLNVALAKGRLADSCADIFIKCGIRAEILKEETRKLVLETPDKKFRFFFVKATDVPTYVEYGLADIGVAGGDGCAVLFKKGEILRKIPEEEVVEQLLKEINQM